MSLDLDAIERRADMATPGPWERETGERERQYVAAVPMGGKRSYAIVADSGGRHPWADADFIAHTRTDVPALIARVRELEAQVAASKPDAFDFMAHLQRQREWSAHTFGPGDRAKGVIDHIRKELFEIEADPTDLNEWIDVVILALDGAWRSGAMPNEIIAALVAKQAKNETRTWPDWRTADPDKAIEHTRIDEESRSSQYRIDFDGMILRVTAASPKSALDAALETVTDRDLHTMLTTRAVTISIEFEEQEK